MLFFSGAAQANNPLSDYARARVADASGQIGIAAKGYASALSGAPFDETLVARAYRRAVAAGDRRLAVQAAQSLQTAEALPPDGELLFLIEAFDDGDWGKARRIVVRVEEQELFASLVPVMRAWIAFGAGDADPLEIIDTASEESSATIYLREHRALLLFAMGRFEEGVTATLALREFGPPRFLRLRLAAAARLVQAGRRDEALAFISGDSRAEIAARAVIERRRSLPGAIDSAADGMGELFVRLAADINRQKASALALTISRFATFIAPDNSGGWFVTSGILNQAEQEEAALIALDGVDSRDPFYSDVQDMRVQLLADTDEPEAALQLARECAGSRNAAAADWQRYGERYTALERHDEAAEAYGRAVTLAGGEEAPWSAWLLYGGALLDADRWADSRPALEKAAELAPNQPIALNYLGYALLEHREDLEWAKELVLRASELSPNSASITDSLGWVYYIQGDLDRAIPTLERAAVGEPAEPAINEHLGDAYWTAGRRRDARFAWQAALVSAEDEAAERIRQKLDIGLTAETASP